MREPKRTDYTRFYTTANFTARDRTPFTYSIKHNATGRWYYGVRFCKGCLPSDLGSKYFSSSRILKELLLEEGLRAFDFKVRQVFSSHREATDWEHKVLSRTQAITNPRMLNRSLGNDVILWHDWWQSASPKEKEFVRKQMKKGLKNMPLEKRKKLSANMSAFQKQRWIEMSDSERNRIKRLFSKSMKYRFAVMSDLEKKHYAAQIANGWRNMDPNARIARINLQQEYLKNLTPEQRVKAICTRERRYAQRSENDCTAFREVHKQWWKTLTPEARTEHVKKIEMGRASAHSKERMCIARQKYWRSLTPEQLANHRARLSVAQKKRWQFTSLKERIRFGEKIRTARLSKKRY